MKKLIYILFLFLMAGTVQAAPYYSFQRSMLPIDSTENIGTTTAPWDVGFFNQICLGGVCNTSWPTGGGAAGAISTTTDLANTQVVFSTGIASIGNDSAFTWNSTADRLTFTYGSSTVQTITNAFISKMGNLASAGFVKTSSDGTLSVDTSTYLTTVDISANTNLTGGLGLTLTGDDMACDTASGSVFGCLSSTDWTTFNNKGSGTVTAVSVASANGFAGSSSGGATPALTLTTSITGMLKGNGTAISAGANGTDYTLITAKTCTAGDFVSSVTAGGVFTCTTPAGTTYTGTYPVVVTGSVLSLAFGTTTSNTWAGTQTFTNQITGSISGNAGTATALASNGANCSAGSYPLGVDASGAVESCTVASSGGSGTVSTSTNEVANRLPLWTSSSATPATLGMVGAGTNGHVLAMVNGVPTFVATTTAGTGLSYNGTSFTVNTSQNIATLSNLTSNGFIKTGSSNGTLSIDTTTYESGLTAGDGLTRTVNDFDCDIASGSVFGCLSTANWNTFNNKIGTSTAPTLGHVAYWGGTATTPALSSVATSTLAVGASISSSGTLGYQIGGTASTLSLNMANANSWTALQTFAHSSTTGQASFIHASTTNFTFGGITGNDWTDFCVAITGSAGLCDGDDGTGVGGGITSLGPTGQGQTGSTQLLASSTTGTDFTITSSGNTHTFNLPTASASNRGLLSTTDWSTFNNKQATISATWPVVLTGTTLSFGGLSTSSNPTIGHIPYFSGVNTFSSVATGTVASGAGISVTAGQSIIGSGLTITNTAPDQTVTLNNGTGISVSGTYPTFTITNTGSTFAFPWAVNTGYNSTTTVIGFNGLFSTASSTFSSAFRLSSLTQGSLYVGSTGLVNTVATSTPTVSAPITYSGTLGSFLGGSTGAFGCTNASAGVTGCLTGTDWSTFNNKQATITDGDALTFTGATLNFDGGATPGGSLGGTWASPTIDDLFILNTGDVGTGSYTFPYASTTALSTLYASTTLFHAGGLSTCDATTGKIVWANGTFGCGTDFNTGSGGSAYEIATTSSIGVSQLAYFTKTSGLTTMGGVATSTLSATSPLTGSFTQVGTGGALGIQVANTSQAGYLASADWNTFNGKAETSSAMTGTFDGIDFTGGALAQNALWVGGAGATPSELAVGTGGYILGVSAGAPAWIATTSIPLGGDVTGTLSATVVGDNSHAHDSTTISGIDISADTNLTGGVGLTLTGDDMACDTASGSVFGCLSSANWTTFNNKENALTFTWPLIRTSNTVSWGGLSTSSTPTISHLPYFTGVNTFGSIATTTASCAGTLSCTSFTVLGSSPITLTGTGGSGSSKWSTTTNELAIYPNTASWDMFLGSNASSTAPFWFDVSATTTYIGNGGGGDSFVTLGSNSNEWTIGYDETDKSFAIASSTTLGTNNAFSIAKSTLATTLSSLIVSGASNLSGGTATLGVLGGSIDAGGATFFEIPNGTAPTANDPGEIAHDTTGNQLVVDDYVMANADQIIWSRTVASTSPAFIAGSLMPLPTRLDGFTITRIQCHVVTGTSKVIAIEDASANASEDITCATTNTTDDGSITNATFTASELGYIDFGATSGSVDYVNITVYGQWTRE